MGWVTSLHWISVSHILIEMIKISGGFHLSPDSVRWHEYWLLPKPTISLTSYRKSGQNKPPAACFPRRIFFLTEIDVSTNFLESQYKDHRLHYQTTYISCGYWRIQANTIVTVRYVLQKKEILITFVHLSSRPTAVTERSVGQTFDDKTNGASLRTLRTAQSARFYLHIVFHMFTPRTFRTRLFCAQSLYQINSCATTSSNGIRNRYSCW